MNLDKFYTSEKAAKKFISNIERILNLRCFDTIIEPSAGNGSLLKFLPNWTIAIDILPEADGIIKQDFFDFEFPPGNNLVVMNPPFGKRSKLAARFFNRSSLFVNTICCIVPVTWEKERLHKKLLNSEFEIIFQERLPEDSFIYNGKPYKVRCTQQIWKRITRPPIPSKTTTYNHLFDIKIGLQTSDDGYFINHPKSNAKGFKASTLEHVQLLYPYDSNGNWDGINRQYGKVQGLNQLGVEKIAVPLMFDGSKPFKTERLDTDVIVYSGYYVTGNLDYAQAMFESESFLEHLKNNCEPKLGGWYRVTKEAVLSFNPVAECIVNIGDYGKAGLSGITFCKQEIASHFIPGNCPQNIKDANLYHENNRGYFAICSDEVVKMLKEIDWYSIGKGVSGNGLSWFSKQEIYETLIGFYNDQNKDFIAKTVVFEEAEFSIRSVRAKLLEGEDHKSEYFSERGHPRSHIGIKPLVPGVIDVFRKIDWDKYTTGTTIPSVSVADVTKAYYETKYNILMGSLIPTESELKYVGKDVEFYNDKSKDFIISTKYNPLAEFVVRGVRPLISDDVEIFKRISHNTRYYSVQPLVPGVREVFESIDWKMVSNGTAIPTVSIQDCIEAYNKALNR